MTSNTTTQPQRPQLTAANASENVQDDNVVKPVKPLTPAQKETAASNDVQVPHEQAIDTTAFYKHEPTKQGLWPLGKLFPITKAPEKAKILGAAPNPGNPFVRPVDKNHQFSLDFLREMKMFLEQPRGDSFFCFGPTGSGKSTGIVQVLARLNWPVQEYTCSEDTEIPVLRGQIMPRLIDGAMTTVYNYGPLAIAMKYGHALILNELDHIRAGQLTELNDILEGKPMLIPETGEVIYPHSMFRIFATANSAGGGDTHGLHSGIQIMNSAGLGRYRFHAADYMAEEAEIRLVMSILTNSKSSISEDKMKILEKLATRMVKSANAVRTAYVGSVVNRENTDVDGVKSSPLTNVICTRVVKRWAFLYTQTSQALGPKALHYSLDHAFLRRLRNDGLQQECIAIEKMIEGFMGEDFISSVESN